jgi:uncharacterized 2Fe-2S/4Fe-4S cluster protein (DUF4445 family)
MTAENGPASPTVKVTFEPTGRSVTVQPGTRVIEAAGRAGLHIDAPCGGAGTCGKCRVRFITGKAPLPSDAGQDQLSDADRQAGWRLACQAVIDRECVIDIPQTSLFAEQIQILTATTEIDEAAKDDLPDEVIRCPVEIVPDAPNFGVAFDIGTTTLVGELLELPGGHERTVAAEINPQVTFGDDVVSRIGRACETADTADEMTAAVRNKLSQLIDNLCEQAGVDRTTIRAVSFAGNTTMQHLLCGLDVSRLAQLPFEPATHEPQCLPADRLGLQIAPHGRAYVLPVIGGFVGGDTVAGILSTRMDQPTGNILMIDIGTNGEIVLRKDETLLAASAAAGPAFEGARISCGMRAAAGAIEKVVIDGQVQTSVIGGGRAIGICGSALVDVAAELLRSGAMDETGRLLPADELPESARFLSDHLIAGEDGQAAFLLARGNADAPDVTIAQRDIRELQLATGALRAGVAILLKQVGLDTESLDRVLIAGGFGSFIRRANAQRIGLIPDSLPSEKVAYVGNVSLHGAKWVLVSAAARQRAEQLARDARHVELSSDMDFQMAFAEAMMFPSD